MFFLSGCLAADPTQEFPVLYKGRYRPAEGYARLWLYDISHRQTLKIGKDPSALGFLWSLEFSGSSPYENAPLFWIGSAAFKKQAGLPLKRDRFSFLELQHVKNDENLRSSLKEFENSSLEEKYQNRLKQLQKQGIEPKKIGELLEQEYPINQRLHHAGTLFKVLPSRFIPGDWLPIKALTIMLYNPEKNALEPIRNFTPYSDTEFANIVAAYQQQNKEKLSQALYENYATIAGKIIRQAHGKSLTYPTFEQLKIESLYMSFPWVFLLICMYGVALFFLAATLRSPGSFLKKTALGFFSLAFFLHTAILAARCYILQRPPVSNMFETVIYVPWIAGCASLLHPSFRRQPWCLIAACAASILLLIITEIADLNQSLDQVQAVLDSQFWLMIHVLLVVGSYGIFILGAILGHLYLILYMMRKEKTMPFLPSLILQSLYGGTTLLVTGTILGGMWAAESWGRFWDWDPKESWAFISSCIYLIWIHAYRFNRIGSFGLAFGAVSGILAISFTWYGVNYILGTGLHSYGFGSGGEFFYYAFLGIEVLFLILSFLFYCLRQSYLQKNF